MSRRALVLTYHAIGSEPGPLATAPELFAEQLDVLCQAGADTVTIGELARRIRTGTVSGREVAMTFDDGFRSVPEQAAPLLAERGMPATVFCVAGHLGGESDWPSRRTGTPTMPLADAAELRELAAAGFEIGCHGMTHAPLRGSDAAFLRREVTGGQAVLEEAVGVPVRSFALPYGAVPSTAARRLLEEAYDAACTTRVAPLRGDVDPYSIPRIDAHYLRKPALLRRALSGSLRPYLQARSLGASSRRRLVKDYA